MNKFNPYDWMSLSEKRVPEPEQIRNKEGIEYDVSVVIRRIEAHQLDLTMNYHDWIAIGFALADEFGESGRDDFHRISRFHQDYNYEKCNQQFDKCLRGEKSGISIKTFFYLAQSAGINIKV